MTQDRAKAAKARHANSTPSFFSGTERMRLPVAAKIALSTAGAATQIVGSPTPPQKPPLGITIVSTFGMSLISIDVVIVKVMLLDAAVLDCDPAIEQRGQPIDEGARDLPLDLRRIDRVAGIRRRDDAMQLDLVAIDTEISAAAAT